MIRCSIFVRASPASAPRTRSASTLRPTAITNGPTSPSMRRCGAGRTPRGSPATNGRSCSASCCRRCNGGIAAILDLPDPRTIAIAPNTHALLNRILSCFPPNRPVRILSTDAEFHSFRRQVARLEEDGLAVCTRVPAEPYESFAARFRDAAAKGGHDLVFVSQVFFTSGATCGDIESLVAAVPDRETFVVIDGYHGYMARPTEPVEGRGARLLHGRRLQVCDGGRRHLLPALPSRLRTAPARHRLVRRVRRARGARRQDGRLSGRRIALPRGDLRSRRDLPHARRARHGWRRSASASATCMPTRPR